jgi:hypothetical protein
VQVAMMTTDALATQFGRMRADLLCAAETAEGVAASDALALPDLVDHLRRRAGDVEAQGLAFAAQYRDLGDKAAKLLLLMPSDARS